MGTALFTGVSGMLAFQRRLDVIANNIANVNTTGYRSSRILFQDQLSQTLQGARGPSGSFGGANPMQVGLGVSVGTIDTNFTQGSLQTTGVSSDLAIQGTGFFVLNDGASNFYSRDGSFSLNSNGAIIDPATGMFLQGFGVDANGNINESAGIGNLTVPLGGQSIVQATTSATLIGNLDAASAVGDTVIRTFTVFDSLGTEQQITLTFTKRAQVTDGGTDYNAWSFQADFGGIDVTNLPGGALSGVVLFDNDGAFHDVGTVDGADAFTTFAGDIVSIPIGLFPGPSLPTTSFDFTFDMTGVTEQSADNDVTLSDQDGFPRGALERFSIAQGGLIVGIFTNGLTQTLGQVAVATFSNVGGLARSGSNLFIESASSGPSQIGLPNSGGRGEVTGGVLEGSNVDLATEFSNMIVTQRGFQANARTISAADTILQETVNLIR